MTASGIALILISKICRHCYASAKLFSSPISRRNMLVVMHSHAPQNRFARLRAYRIVGAEIASDSGAARTAIGITGNDAAWIWDPGIVTGVAECIPVSKPYKLVSRDAKEEDSIIRIPRHWVTSWLAGVPGMVQVPPARWNRSAMYGGCGAAQAHWSQTFSGALQARTLLQFQGLASRD